MIMLRHVLAVVIYFRTSNAFFGNQLGESFTLTEEMNYKNCTSLETNSKRFFFKQINQIYVLEDVCEHVPLTSLNYFPKCCPPGFSYQTFQHKCVRDEENITNIYDGLPPSLLIKSHLDCAVMIDNYFIKDNSPVLYEDRSITFKGKKYKVDEYCVDWDATREEVLIRTCENLNVCQREGIKCIRKCCKDGYAYLKRKCILNPEYGISVTNISRFEDNRDNFNGVVLADKCRRYPDHPRYNLTIKPNGKLLMNTVNKWVQYSIEDNAFCIEYLVNEKFHNIFFCTLKNTEVIDLRFYIYRIANIISCISIILTLIGYLTLQELKNFLGKIIACYCVALLTAFILLTNVQFNPYQENICTITGFLVPFFMLAAFAWMNVLSFEIWRALGSMTIRYGTQLYNERKKFLLYNAYAWSVPILIMGFAVLDRFMEILPEYLRPRIGVHHCLFVKIREREDYNYGYYLFFAIPSALLLLANSILFLKTIRYINKVKNDIATTVENGADDQKRRKILNVDIERVAMVFRIFLIMGLSWLFESVSVLIIDFQQNYILGAIEVIIDTFNCLQGFLIFCVCMLKKKIIDAVKRKWKCGKIYKKSSTSSTTEEAMHNC